MYEWVCATVAHSILCVNNLYVNGNEDQRMRFLPDLCNGSQIGGICITDPDGGTDVAEHFRYDHRLWE